MTKVTNALKAEIKCIEECADRLAAIAKKSGEYGESLDLLSQNLRITSKNALCPSE